MNKYNKLLVALILSIITIFFIVRAIGNIKTSYETKSKQMLLELNGSLSSCTGLLNEVKSSFVYSIRLDSVKLHIRLLDGEIKLNSPKLVFYFDENACISCIEQQIELLRELNNIESSDIVLLGSWSNIRDSHVFRQIREIPFEVLSAIEINQEITDIGVPVYFMLDKNYIASRIFVPIYQLPEISREYLERIVFDL